MSIIKQQEGKFLVRETRRCPITRKQFEISRKAESKAEARRIQDQILLELQERMKRQQVPVWEDVVVEYVKTGKDGSLSEMTKYNQDKVLRKHTFACWGQKHIDEITTAEIMALMRGLLPEYSEAHRKYVLKCIRGAFTFALHRGYVNTNPTPLIKFKIGQKIQAVLTEPQIIKLLDEARRQEWEWFPHYAVALFTGMRNGELYALKWDQVDLAARKILVNRSWNNRSGFKSTKSGDDRVVEIAHSLLPVLQELRLKTFETGYVLPRHAKWDKGEQARELRMFLKLIGLPTVRFHDLRASWATLLLSKGTPPPQVMAMGGWKDLKTMMIYLRKAGIDTEGATNCLDHIQLTEKTEAKVLPMFQ
jgi:integrase